MSKIKAKNVREMINSMGATQAADELLFAIGLTDERGNRPRDEHGRQIISKENTLRRSDVSIRALAEAYFGYEFFDGGTNATKIFREAGAGAVNPSTFANISGFSIAVGGLLEHAILERFQLPEFIGATLVANIPTSVLGGTKAIGIANIGDQAAQRLPGMPVKMIGLDERWVEYPETVEHSLGMDITYEAIAGDLTGDLENAAGQIGERLGYRKEVRIADMILGVTNTYNYKGNAFNTYQTVAPWVNDFVNPITDWNDVNDVLQLFSKMTDPETGLPVLVTPTAMIGMPAKLLTLRKIFRDTVVQARTQAQANVSIGDNPIFGLFDPMASPIWRARARAADGLNLSETNADGLTYIGDFAGAFGYREFHPLMVQQAAPNSPDLISRRVLSSFYAFERGVPVTKEPRKVVRSKQA